MATDHLKTGADPTLETSYILNILPEIMDNVSHDIRVTKELSITGI
jgi:hypothetical protein